jgi:hypothetical protein
MVLTSIVNNKTILNEITSDIRNRFKIEIDEQKLEAYLNTVEVEVKQNITLA